MPLAQRFEDLEIWQKARVQVPRVYSTMAECRDWGFRDQIQRASISVMNNIAEGFERRTRGDFAHFLDMAKGSNGELRSMCYAAEDLSYMDGTEAAELRAYAERLSGSIASFCRHLRA